MEDIEESVSPAGSLNKSRDDRMGDIPDRRPWDPNGPNRPWDPDEPDDEDVEEPYWQIGILKQMSKNQQKEFAI